MDVRLHTVERIVASCRSTPSLLTATIPDDGLPPTEHVTMLWQAAALGNIELATALLSFGSDAIDVNFARCCDQVSCLYIAAQNGHAEMCSVLLRAGADANARRNTLATPLFIATQRNHVEVVSHLLKSNADTELENNQKCTPFVLACNMGHTDVARLLMQRGCNIFHRGTGLSPLMWCKTEKRLETLEVVRRWILQHHVLPKVESALVREVFAFWTSLGRRSLAIKLQQDNQRREEQRMAARHHQDILDGAPLPSFDRLIECDFTVSLGPPRISAVATALPDDDRARHPETDISFHSSQRHRTSTIDNQDQSLSRVLQALQLVQRPTPAPVSSPVFLKKRVPMSRAYRLQSKTLELLGSSFDSATTHAFHEALCTQHFS